MFTGHSSHNNPPTHRFNTAPTTVIEPTNNFSQLARDMICLRAPRAINRCTIHDVLLCINSRDPWPERCCHSNLYFLTHCNCTSTGEI